MRQFGGMSNAPAAPSSLPPSPGLHPKITGDKPKSASDFTKPVDWLLGRELLTYLRSMSLYSSNGSELDHRDWMHPEVIDLDQPGATQGEDYWFDYMADSGDGQMAMYSLAYLTLGDLWRDQESVSLSALDGAERLPRGAFLFLGGDTAYHVADRGTLVHRFSAPFDWAHKDRQDEGTLAGHAPGQAAPILFAIPGNHDYYDSLLGFNHLFRYNSTPFDRRPLVADFERRQDASFVVLKLPFDWSFWGLDTQNGKIDWRQKRFVLDHASELCPKRLIVCTPEPTTVFEKVIQSATEPYKALNLPRPFSTGTLPPNDHIHLDIAGDVHHYARHTLVNAPNYASIVSGGGGAFLHPSHTKIPDHGTTVEGSEQNWPAPAAKLYPDPERSCRETNLRLLCPWKIFQGGYVWLIGAICAAVIYFGASVAPHTRALSTMVGQWISPFAFQETDHREAPISTKRDLEGLQKHLPALFPTSVSVDDDDAIDAPLPSQVTAHSVSASEHKLLSAELLAAILVLTALALSFALSSKAKAMARTKIVTVRQYVKPLVVVASAIISTAVVYHYVDGTHDHPMAHPFVSSLMILLFALPLPAAWIWISTYVPTLPKQGKLRKVASSDYYPVWIALGTGVLSVTFGLLVYGIQAIGHTISDLLFVFAFFFVGIGPALLGWFQGGAGHMLKVKLVFGLMGLYLGVLQISIPLLIALDGNWLRALAVLAWTLGITAVTATLFSSIKRSKYICLMWLLAGGGALAISVIGHSQHQISLLRMVVALGSAATLTCVWFGWYLASALAFGGHNNEAGGAAHLDRHRHFIRFKVQKDKLTGYVIGIAKPNHIGKNLSPVLVEVFELHTKD
jgi:hypothetical protein